MIRIIPAAAALLLLFLPVFTHAQNKAPAEMPLEAVQRVARQVMSAEEKDYLLKIEAQIGCILSDMGYPIRGPRACPVTNLPPIVDR